MQGGFHDDPQRVSIRNVWNYRQNKVRRVVRDLVALGVDEGVARNVLMARGVNKAMGMRADLVDMKNEMRGRVTFLLLAIRMAKAFGKPGLRREFVGRLKELERYRREVHRICHGPRWRCCA